MQAYFQGAAGTVSLNVSGISASIATFYTAGYVLQDAPDTNYVLTLTNSSGLSAQNTSGAVTVSAPVNLAYSGGGTLGARTGGTLAVTGNVTASGGLYLSGSSGTTFSGTSNQGTIILSGNNAVTGLTRLDYGVVAQLAGTGNNQPLGGTSSLQVTNQATLVYGASNQVPAGIPVQMFANGTINVNGNSQSLAARLGVLTVSSSYTGDSQALDFGAGVSTGSVLAFANSSAAAWSGTLNVYDYRGTPGVGGGVDQLYFGSDATGLTTTQLGEIDFYSGGAGSTLLGTGTILGDGEVTYSPVPEPATWLGGALLLGTLGRLGLRRHRYVR